jgi:hypothetical protein
LPNIVNSVASETCYPIVVICKALVIVPFRIPLTNKGNFSIIGEKILKTVHINSNEPCNFNFKANLLLPFGEDDRINQPSDSTKPIITLRIKDVNSNIDLILELQIEDPTELLNL